jgi:hypothetical protein
MTTVPALMAFQKKDGFYKHKPDTAVTSFSVSATKIRSAFSFVQIWQGKVFTSAVFTLSSFINTKCFIK